MLIAIFATQMLFFSSTNDIFLVCSTHFLVCRKKNCERAVASVAAFWQKFCRVFQEKNFDHTVKTFAALWHEFCRLIARVLTFFAILC